MALKALLASSSGDLFLGCFVIGDRLMARLMDALWKPVSTARAWLVISLARYFSSKSGGILFIRLISADCNLFVVFCGMEVGLGQGL